MSLFVNFKTELMSYTTVDGKLITEGEDGKLYFEDGVLVPDGEHTMQDETVIVVKDGMIVKAEDKVEDKVDVEVDAMKDKEKMSEEMKDEEIKAEDVAVTDVAVDTDAMVSRIAELESALADLTKQLADMKVSKETAEVALKKAMLPKTEDKKVEVKASKFADKNLDASTENVLIMMQAKLKNK